MQTFVQSSIFVGNEFIYMQAHETVVRSCVKILRVCLLISLSQAFGKRMFVPVRKKNNLIFSLSIKAKFTRLKIKRVFVGSTKSNNTDTNWNVLVNWWNQVKTFKSRKCLAFLVFGAFQNEDTRFDTRFDTMILDQSPSCMSSQRWVCTCSDAQITAETKE